MPTTTFTPTLGTSIDAGFGTVDWLNPMNAVSINATEAKLAKLQQWPADYLKLSAMSQTIPSGNTVLGFQIEIYGRSTANTFTAHAPITLTEYYALAALWTLNHTGIPPAEADLFNNPLNYFTVIVWLSSNGTTPKGEGYVVFLTDQYGVLTMGGPTQLLGQTWTAAEINNANFAILVEYRQIGPPPTPILITTRDDVWVDAGLVRVTHEVPGGSLTMNTNRQTSNEKVLIAPESTPGTAGTSFKHLRALNYKVGSKANVKKFKPQGEKLNSVVIPTQEWSAGAISGLADYGELPILWEGTINRGVHSGAGVVDQRNIHTYIWRNRSESDGVTFTLQRGDKIDGTEGVGAEQVTYLLHQGAEFQINTKDVTIAGSFMAGQRDPVSNLAAGVNEIQTLTITGTPAGGTFRLNVYGAETSDLAFNISGAALQTALLALGTVGSGQLTVTGSGPYVVTFAGTYAGRALQPIRLARNNLTGGTLPSMSIVRTTPGGWAEYPHIPILPKHVKIYMANTYAGLIAGAKLAKCVASGVSVGDRWQTAWVIDRDVSSFADRTETDPKLTAHLTVHKDSAAMGYITQMRAGTTVFLRIECVGPLIGATSDNHKVIIEGAVKFSEPGGDDGDDEGRVVIPYDLEFVEGPNGELPTIVVENGVVSY